MSQYIPFYSQDGWVYIYIVTYIYITIHIYIYLHSTYMQCTSMGLYGSQFGIQQQPRPCPMRHAMIAMLRGPGNLCYQKN